MLIMSNSFSVVNNVAMITGDKGPYDNKVNNPSVKYGRNAMANMTSYVKEFSKPLPGIKFDFANAKQMDNDTFANKAQDAENQAKTLNDAVKSMPPLKFEYKYMPGQVDGKNIDKNALLGTAFEEMGKTSMPVSEMNEKVQKGLGSKVDASPMDLNHDNNIDVGEYSSSILLEDMASKDGDLKQENITGSINNKGENSLAQLFTAEQKEKTSQILSGIYKDYALDAAQQDFEKEPNNTQALNLQA